MLLPFVLGVVTGAAGLWFLGDRVRGAIEGRPRTARTRAAGVLETAAGALQTASGALNAAGETLQRIVRERGESTRPVE